MTEEGIYNLLATDPTITPLVSGRVTPVILPKSPALPAITFFLVVSTSVVNLDATAVNTVRVEIDAWSKSYLEAKQIQAALHNLLDGWSGTLSDGTRVLEASSNDNPDFFEKDSLLYRASTTFTLLT